MQTVQTAWTLAQKSLYMSVFKKALFKNMFVGSFQEDCKDDISLIACEPFRSRVQFAVKKEQEAAKHMASRGQAGQRTTANTCVTHSSPAAQLAAPTAAALGGKRDRLTNADSVSHSLAVGPND